MRNINISVVFASLFTALYFFTASTFAATTVNTNPNFTKFGFPTVLKTLNVINNKSYTFTSDGITVTIPSGAFGENAKFELLMGMDNTFNKLLPKGNTVVTNFAFKVTNSSNSKIIDIFKKPITISVKNININAKTIYYNVTPTTPLKVVQNPVQATIIGTTLTHQNPVSEVGWVIATPTNSLQKTIVPIKTTPQSSSSTTEDIILVVLGLLVIAFIGRQMMQNKIQK